MSALICRDCIEGFVRNLHRVFGQRIEHVTVQEEIFLFFFLREKLGSIIGVKLVRFFRLCCFKGTLFYNLRFVLVNEWILLSQKRCALSMLWWNLCCTFWFSVKIGTLYGYLFQLLPLASIKLLFQHVDCALKTRYFLIVTLTGFFHKNGLFSSCTGLVLQI